MPRRLPRPDTSVINAQAAYLRDVLRRSTFADTSFETLLSEFVAAQLALVDLVRFAHETDLKHSEV